MRPSLLLLTFAATIFLVACDNLDIVDKSQSKVITKEQAKEYVLVNRADLEQLKLDASAGRSVGRFREYRQGFRTWRLDTSTGNNCILLTTEWDWKKPDTSAQGCDPTPNVPSVSVRTLEP